LFSKESLAKSLMYLGIDDMGDIFEKLSEQYCGPSRHYHSDQHITECLCHFKPFCLLADHPAEIETAIWFHDAIYDSHQSDNEEQSALWARSYLASQSIAEASILRIEAMIIATKTHQPISRDSEVLLDIDLGILGTSEAAFDTYDQAIRREYDWVPEQAYETGRKQVLKSFLARERIYHTEAYFEKYEAQARQNITRRIGR